MITLEIASERKFPWTTIFNVTIHIAPEAFLAMRPSPEEIEALKQADIGTVADKLDAIALIARMLERQGLDSEVVMKGDLEEFSFSGAKKFKGKAPYDENSLLGALHLVARVVTMNAGADSDLATKSFVEGVAQDVAARKERAERDA